MKEGDSISIIDARNQVLNAAAGASVQVKAGTKTIEMKLAISGRQAKMLLAGGLLNFTKEGADE